MLCQRCHKNLATARYAEVVDGKVTDRYLCEECMAQYQESRATGFELTGAPNAPRRAAVQSAVREPAHEQRCDTCGTLLGCVLEHGYVGCNQCYANFREPIEDMLRERQCTLVHRGKNPELDDARARLRADMQTKRTLLRSLLRREKYEEAAKLRDEISELETGLAITETD
ncbi:MAG: UvrB/UvrC motif-containing protein [Candidatus Hydrogenedentota bacterium]